MKRITSVILAGMFAMQGFSQSYTPPAYADIDTTYRTYVNNVFGLLEPNRVSTGLLLDYAFDFTDPKIYKGVSLHDSTLVEQGIYSELYKTLYTARFNSTVSGMRHPSVHDSLCYIARQKEVITLSGLLFKYNAIHPNAQANGKMETVNGQLKDKYVSGVWQNPYEEFTAAAISPSIIDYNLTYCSVVLPSGLFLSNISGQVSSIQLDADDGNGYQTLAYDTPISLNYADTGWKHWVFKITLNTSEVLYSHSKLHFDSASNKAGSGGAAARGEIDARVAITADEAFEGVQGIADIVISYRNESDQVLRRPLIIAEGLDAGWITSPEKPEGESTFSGFIQTVRNSNSATLQALISDDPSTYDIVYINWRNGTDWLQRNALALEAVIRWVNANKQPLGGVRQPNVVLGSSMGGVIARMALGRMDRGEGSFNGTGGFNAHETNLYISLDAPHQGANVPLGYQALARHGLRLYLRSGPVAIGITEVIQLIRNGPSPLQNLLLADQPAARQLLSNRIDVFFNAANGTHTTFMNALRTQWDYPNPANVRSIAISNGSECGIDQEFAAGSSLLYHNRTTKTRFLGDLFFMGVSPIAIGLSPLVGTYSPYFLALAIPGSNKFSALLDIKALASGGGNQVYHGQISYTKKVLWLLPVTLNITNRTYNAPSGLLPFDTYPGGFYTVTIGNQPGSVSRDWMFSYDNTFSIQRRFAFIHTTSALDVGEGNTTITNTEYMNRYPSGTPQAAPFQIPFDNFNTAYNQNPITINKIDDDNNVIWQFTSTGDEPHEGLYIRSANWLAQELNGNAGVSCIAACQSLSISGPDFVCTTSDPYTIPGIPAGASVTWQVSPAYATPNTTPALQTTLTRQGSSNGNAVLTATITNPCGGSNIVLTKNIIVGTGNPVTGTYNSPTDPVEPMLTTPPRVLPEYENEACIAFVTNITFPAGATVSWYCGSCPVGVIWYQIGNNAFVNFSALNQVVDLSVTVTTACGSKGTGYRFRNVTMASCGIQPLSEPVEELRTATGISLSPNPAHTSLTVQLTGDAAVTNGSGTREIQLTDKTGRVIRRYNYAAGKQITLDVSALRPDVYYIRVFDGKQWQGKAFIKN